MKIFGKSINNQDIGSNHCRVIPVDEDADVSLQILFWLHFFAYTKAIRWIAPQARVLEIGSGEGYGANYLCSHFYDVIATDLSLKALRHASVCYPKIKYCQALGTNLPFFSSTFDVVVSFQVIEHVHDVRTYVREVYRVLKPKGRFILTTPNRNLRLLPFQKPWNPYHVREYNDKEFHRLLRRFFEDVQIYGIAAKPEIMDGEKRRVRQNPIQVYASMIKHYLTKIFPESLLKTVGKPMSIWIRKRLQATSVKSAPMNLRSVKLDDFFLSSDLNSSLHFFAIATKRE